MYDVEKHSVVLENETRPVSISSYHISYHHLSASCTKAH